MRWRIANGLASTCRRKQIGRRRRGGTDDRLYPWGHETPISRHANFGKSDWNNHIVAEEFAGHGEAIFVTFVRQDRKIALKGKLGFRLLLQAVSGPRVSGLA
jgi:hypothetical protein